MINILNVYQFIVIDSFAQLPLYRKFFQKRPVRECGDGIVCVAVFWHNADRDCTRRGILWRRLEEDQAAIKTT
jgi:hypothetical protein